MRYVWADKYPLQYKGSAQSVGEELERIRQQKGELSPKTVVEQARSLTSPLHDYFEWNDQKAAESHRRHQARQLITAVRVVYKENSEPKTMRPFVKLTGSKKSYVSTVEVMNDAEKAAMLLEQLRRDLHRVYNKYQQHAHLSKMALYVDQLGEIVAELQQAAAAIQ